MRSVWYKETSRKQSLRVTAFAVMGACLLSSLLSATMALRMNHAAVQEEQQKQAESTMVFEDKYATAFDGDASILNLRNMLSLEITADGESRLVFMMGGTVAQALECAGLKLGEYDYTEPALDETVSMGSRITVHRVSYEEKVTEESIPAETQVVYTSLYKSKPNKVTVMQEGRDGVRTIVTKEHWIDGVLQSAEVISDEITVAPVDRVVKKYGAGAPVSPLTGPDGTTNAPTSYKRVLTGQAAGYSSKGGKGASGLGLDYGTVAVDPKIIPYGTLLYIVSKDGSFVYGYAIATDTGNAVCKGTIIVDLYYKTYEESCLNGMKDVNVYVVG